MTDPQSNRLDMFNLVSTVYTTYQAVIDTVPARTAAFTKHNTNRNSILQAVGGQSSSTIGPTIDKAQAREELNLFTDTVFAPVRAWAAVNGNNTIGAQFKLSPTQISQIKDDTIQAFLELRITIVNDNIAALNDYGITAPLVTQWQAALTTYLSFLTAPRGAIVQRSVQTSNLRSLFKQTSDHLKKVVDPLMITLRTSQPDLYDTYTRSRIIIDRRGPGNGNPPTPPTPSVDIKISGTVAGNMFPLPNASITVTVGATSYPTIAGPAGIYAVSIPNPSPSTPATITASAPNFTPETRNITLEPNQNQTQDFNLTSAPPMP